MDQRLDQDLGRTLGGVRHLARVVFDRPRLTWPDLADAGLLGVHLPEEHGGGGGGIDALVAVLREQGRAGVEAPLWSAGVAALAVARHGTHVQRLDLVPAAVRGVVRLTVALGGPHRAAAATPVRGVRTEAGWTVSGPLPPTAAPAGADHVLVAARTSAGLALFLVACDDNGLRWHAACGDDADAGVRGRLDGAAARLLGRPGADLVADVARLARLARAAVRIGRAEAALLASGGGVPRHGTRPLAGRAPIPRRPAAAGMLPDVVPARRSTPP